MGRVLIGALIVGGALGLMLTTITGGAGVFLTARNAKNRSQFLWRFAVAGVIVLTLCVVAANQHPYATVRPGSDYDVALQNLFLQCFGYCASPGTAALMAAKNKLPSGPKASGPMDLNSGFPSFMPTVQSAAAALARASPSTQDATMIWVSCE